jgi:acyl phosphate:glycerol-3-phosphate acyltransferase
MPDPISWSLAWPYLLAAAIGGYLLGSIPFGLVLTRLAGYGDIRKIGSGNIGTTNVLRTGNKALAAATLVLDSGKGAAAALLALAFGWDTALVAAGASMLGHTFPVWLGFRGGKGVATALGVLLALSWPTGLVACATWLLTALVFRISSLSALVSLGLAPVFAWFWSGPQLAQLALFIAVLVWIRHHANIRRLLRGEEPRIGKRKTADGSATP